ncbi:MAG: DsbA family oxidoreductase [Ktedonobacteraceae bacterium]
MSIKVDVWSDFVCPFCLLVASSLEKLQKEYDLAVHWHSFELRPAGAQPMPPEYLKRILAGRPMLERQAREHYGIEINSGPMGINSRPALIGEKYAQAQGQGKEYHDVLMKAYWQEAKSIDDPQILQELAVEAGLDGAQFRVALTQPAYNAAVDADVALAHEYGLDAVPAMIFGEKFLVMGAQPYEVLRRAVEQAKKEAA